MISAIRRVLNRIRRFSGRIYLRRRSQGNSNSSNSSSTSFPSQNLSQKVTNELIDRKPFMSGLAAIESVQGNFPQPKFLFKSVQGLIHLYKTNYGFNITEEGPSDMLLLVHVPVDLDTHDLLRSLGNYDKKIEHIKIVRDQSLNQYMVLLKFDE